MLLIKPGEPHGPVLLLDCLREIHEEARADRAEEIERRRKAGTPLDDATDWQAVDQVRDELVASLASKDAKTAAELAQKLTVMTQGNKLEPLPEWEADPDLDPVAVVLVVMSDSERRSHMARVADGWRAIRDAHVTGASQVRLRELDEAIVQVQMEMVCAGVQRVSGLESGPIDDVSGSIESIRRSGLLSSLYAVVQHHQSLPAKKAVRFGQRQQSTWASSTTAPPAQSSDGTSTDATGMDDRRTLQEPRTRLAHVHAVSSSTIQT